MSIRLTVLTVIICSLFLSGCGPAKEYAQVRKNMEVDRVFRAGTVLPEYRYYFNGPKAEPRALMALDKNYTLQTELWKAVDLTDAQLQGWINEFKRVTGEYDDIEYVVIDYTGHEILSRDSQRIGMVYTRYHWVVAWFVDGNTITVAPPKPLGSQRGGNIFRRGFR